MPSLFSLFTNSLSSSFTKKVLNEICSSKQELSAKREPLQLRRILKQSTSQQTFIKWLIKFDQLSNSSSSQQANEAFQLKIMFKALKKVCLFHHVVLYYVQFADLIEQIELQKIIEHIKPCWFLQTVIKPYICFVQKYCRGIQMYEKLRSMPNGKKESIFQCMCFAVNIFKCIFKVVNKLASIGRYFREKYTQDVDYFVELMAYHTQIIYQGFKSCVQQIILFSKSHLPKKQDQAIFKQIISIDLPWINEQMKKLFLDKYFYPYGKGYGVKLYKIQDIDYNQRKIVWGILNDHENTERQKQTKKLEEELFPTHLHNRFNHQDLERSFSFTISKFQSLKNEKKNIYNPEKENSYQSKQESQNFRAKFRITSNQNNTFNVKKHNQEEVQQFFEQITGTI